MSIVMIFMLSSVIYPADYKGDSEWLLQPAGARGAAMGAGMAAVIDNANTVFWNPGGAAFLRGINFAHSSSPDIKNAQQREYEMSSLSFTTGIGKSFIIGFNQLRFRIKTRYYSSQNKIYQDSITGFLLGYRRGNIGMGFNAKFIVSTPYSHAFKDLYKALDIGILYSKNRWLKKNILMNTKLGCSITNISGNMKYIDSNIAEIREELPRNLRIGYAVSIKQDNKERKLAPLTCTLSSEYSEILNADKEYNIRPGYKAYGFGLEIGTYEFLFSRIGYRIREGEEYADTRLYNGITYGVGIRLPIYYFTSKYPLSAAYDFGTIPWDKESIYKNANSIRIHSFQFLYEF